MAAREAGLGCAPFHRPVRRFPYLRPLFYTMAEYWCLCVKYADRCARGWGCPVKPEKCAAAYVVVMAVRGSAVRGKFYVWLRGVLPERFYLAVARAASRLFSHLAEDGYIPYEDLVVEAASHFLSRLSPSQGLQRRGAGTRG